MKISIFRLEIWDFHWFITIWVNFLISIILWLFDVWCFLIGPKAFLWGGPGGRQPPGERSKSCLILLLNHMAVSILYPLWKIQWMPSQGPPRRQSILLQQNFLWVEQAGAGRARMPGGQKHKKETNKHTKNTPKRGGAKRRPFLDNLCVLICIFFVFFTPRHPCSASPCLLNP